MIYILLSLLMIALFFCDLFLRDIGVIKTSSIPIIPSMGNDVNSPLPKYKPSFRTFLRYAIAIGLFDFFYVCGAFWLGKLSYINVQRADAVRAFGKIIFTADHVSVACAIVGLSIFSCLFLRFCLFLFHKIKNDFDFLMVLFFTNIPGLIVGMAFSFLIAHALTLTPKA